MYMGLENGYADKPSGLIYYMRNVLEQNVSASTLCLRFLFSLFIGWLGRRVYLHKC